MSTTEPHPPERSAPPRTDRGSPTTRGVVLEVRGTSLVVTVMPASAPPYRARVPIAPDDVHPGIHAGAYVELLIGADPSDIRLARGPSSAE